MSSHKSHKRRHESDEERDKRSKSFPSSSKSSIKRIDQDDYFEKATEFRLWLKESKQKYFDELSSKDARYYFKKFVRKWNHHELEDKYYKGLNSTQLDSSDSTRYKWSFAKNLDKMEMDSVRDSVDSLTGLSRGEDRLRAAGKRRTHISGPTMPDTVDREELQEKERRDRKYQSKKRHERSEAILDEVAPKETGREAAIAKKRALNAYHKRERSPDVELSEADLMGGDDFQSRLAAERRQKERREARYAERREQKLAPIMNKMEEYKAKENATMEMFKRMAEERRANGGF